MDIQFDPEKANQEVKQTAQELVAIGERIIEHYAILQLAEAEMIDAEAAASDDFFYAQHEKKIPVSAMREWLKMRTALQRKALINAEIDLKRDKQLYDMKTEWLNAIKFSFKIKESEANNTNL